eukprot:2219714-Pyramimonas_sp.AAC.2
MPSRFSISLRSAPISPALSEALRPPSAWTPPEHLAMCVSAMAEFWPIRSLPYCKPHTHKPSKWPSKSASKSASKSTSKWASK